MKILYLFSFLLLLCACDGSEVDTVPTNELIIGLSYGECAGDCAFLFLLKDDMVYEDLNVERVGNDPASFEFSSTPVANVDQLRYDSLFSQLPGNLGNFDTEDFGCPDCGDWGSLHVIRSTEVGVYSTYILDNAVDNMNAALRPYGRLMQRSMQEFRM